MRLLFQHSNRIGVNLVTTSFLPLPVICFERLIVRILKRRNAHGLEAGNNISSGQATAFESGFTPLQQVVRQKTDMRFGCLLVNGIQPLHFGSLRL